MIAMNSFIPDKQASDSGRIARPNSPPASADSQKD
jgi:hypothetical protein